MNRIVKFREVRASFSQKGFEEVEGSNHEKYRFIDERGRKTEIRTVLSRRPDGSDLDRGTQGQIARQMRLTTSQFREFVNCSISRADYGIIVANLRKTEGKMNT